MTNNPTIDGVSRAKLEQALRLASVFDDGGDGADAESAQGVAEILRALLDAPAVERQEQGDPPGSFNKHMEYMQENIRLQSTIARLEARVAELESGRGEAPFYISVEDWNLLVRDDVEIASVRASRTRRSKFTEPLYAAPPAPVAVAMSFEFEHPSSKEKRTVTLTKRDVFDGMEDYFYDKLGEQICQCESVGETNVVDCNCDEYVHDFEVVNACLDATAALNGPAK